MTLSLELLALNLLATASGRLNPLDLFLDADIVVQAVMVGLVNLVFTVIAILTIDKHTGVNEFVVHPAKPLHEVARFCRRYPQA